MLRLLLNIILTLYYEGRCQSTEFSGFVGLHDRRTNTSMNSEACLYDTNEFTDDDDSYSYEIDENVVRPFNLSADEYYVDAIREALEMLGDHQQIIATVMKLLDGEEKRVRELRELLNSTENLIIKNIHVLKEKFGLELTTKDMTDPVEKSTVETLLRMWKEVKLALDKLKSNEKIEDLKKWLENVDGKTRAQYDTLGSIMAKIKAICYPVVVEESIRLNTTVA